MNKHFFELSPRTRRIIWSALLTRWQAKRPDPSRKAHNTRRPG